MTDALAKRPLPLNESLYGYLRDVAAIQLAGERRGHTLQPTALLNEAFLRFQNSAGGFCGSRDEICAAMVTIMRRVLVDHARSRGRQKRGGATAKKLPMDGSALIAKPLPIDFLDLDEALNELSEVDTQLARVAELRFLCGMSAAEAAVQLKCSERAVQRDWRFARAWLKRRLDGGV